MKKIILISGKKRHGKDHVAELLKCEFEKKGLSVFTTAFADAPKDILCTSLNITREQFDEYKNNERALFDDEGNELVTFRKLIQLFSTDAMQFHFGNTVWSKRVFEEANKRPEDVVIVSDFRFKHEHISDTTINVFNHSEESNDTHFSENGLEDCIFKHYINNTGKPDLSDEIKKLVSLL